MMDLENMGGIPIRPEDYAGEIAEAVDEMKQSVERRDTEIRWVLDDFAKAEGTRDRAMAGMAALTRIPEIEEAHVRRVMNAPAKLAARMALDMAEAGKLDLPEQVEAQMREVLGIAQPIEQESKATGESTIEGIGNFDDLPTVEPERTIRDADGGFGDA